MLFRSDNKFVAGFIGTPQMNFFDVTVKKSGNNLSALFAGGQKVILRLDGLRKIDERYLDGEEHKLTLGIRGECVLISDKKSESALKSQLAIKEVLGKTTQLFVRLEENGADYVVSFSGRCNYCEGDDIYMSFNEKDVHLFDAETEQSVMGREVGN